MGAGQRGSCIYLTNLLWVAAINSYIPASESGGDERQRDGCEGSSQGKGNKEKGNGRDGSRGSREKREGDDINGVISGGRREKDFDNY